MKRKGTNLTQGWEDEETFRHHSSHRNCEACDLCLNCLQCTCHFHGRYKISGFVVKQIKGEAVEEMLDGMVKGGIIGPNDKLRILARCGIEAFGVEQYISAHYKVLRDLYTEKMGNEREDDDDCIFCTSSICLDH